jgi:hypothetical protein
VRPSGVPHPGVRTHLLELSQARRVVLKRTLRKATAFFAKQSR